MRFRVPIAAFVTMLAFSGCSSKTRASLTTDAQNIGTQIADAASSATDNAAEALARNIATQQGEEQFKNADYELDGPLVCSAKLQGSIKKLNIACTGKTKSGGAAALDGITDEVPGASVVALTGNFVGTVDGAQSFTTDRLGG